MGTKKRCNKQDISNLKSGLFQTKHLSVIDFSGQELLAATC